MQDLKTLLQDLNTILSSCIASNDNQNLDYITSEIRSIQEHVDIHYCLQQDENKELN